MTLAVYKLTTTFYKTNRGFATSKNLTKRKRLSKGHDILEEEFSNVGMDALQNIINLTNVNDGLYVVTVINESYDWETGYVDDYNLILIPYLGVIHNGVQRMLNNSRFGK